jgi:hypothetical protein
VNPEISLAYDEQGRVTQIKGLNDDGVAIADSYLDYIGKDCKTVVQDLIYRIHDAGYLVAGTDGTSRSITLQIQPGSTLPTDTFLNDIAADTQSTVAGLDLANNVVGIGQDDYDAADYGPKNNVLTDRSTINYSSQSAGVTDYNDTDYGPNNDGVTDYGNTDYGAGSDGVTDYGNSGYGNTDYGNSGYDSNDSGYSDYGNS